MAIYNIKHRDNETANVNPQKNNEAMDCWSKAIKYLSEASEKAREIFDYIDKKDKTINIFIETGDKDPNQGWENCWMPVDKLDQLNGSPISNNSTIRWWGGRPKKRGGRGAELALMHELGHEYQWLTMEAQIRKMNLFDYKYGTTKLLGFKHNKKYINDIESWVVREVETPVAIQINAYLKAKLNSNEIVETTYNDLLEPTRTKYATINIFGDPRSIQTVSPKLEKKLLVSEPKGRVRSNAVTDRPVSPIKKSKSIFKKS